MRRPLVGQKLTGKSIGPARSFAATTKKPELQKCACELLAIYDKPCVD